LVFRPLCFLAGSFPFFFASETFPRRSFFILGRFYHRVAFASVSPGKVHIGVFARLPFFILVVIWEIIKANIDVGRIVIDPKLPIDPRIFAYRSRLRGDWEKTLFTYFVNLTPGTVVLDIRDDIYYIHGLAPHHQDGMNEGNQEKMVAWLFGYKLEETAEKSP
jgi:multisubunit Na+/H+ antiporter MnhE subunit